MKHPVLKAVRFVQHLSTSPGLASEQLLKVSISQKACCKGVAKLSDDDKKEILKIVDGATLTVEGLCDESNTSLSTLPFMYCSPSRVACEGYSARALRVLAIAARPMSSLPQRGSSILFLSPCFSLVNAGRGVPVAVLGPKV